METVFSVDEHLILAYSVGNPLLSERDGNEVNNVERSTAVASSRKPTTL